jgi:hypothetical protein
VNKNKYISHSKCVCFYSGSCFLVVGTLCSPMSDAVFHLVKVLHDILLHVVAIFLCFKKLRYHQKVSLRVAHLVQRRAMGWKAWVRFPEGQDFPFSTSSRSALGPTQPN